VLEEFSQVVYNTLLSEACDQYDCLQDGGLSGDGYGAEGSPHTVHEAFAGLGLERAAEVGCVNG